MNPLYTALAARRIFIVYKLVPIEGSPKLDKVPVNPATLDNSNAQDAANWMLPLLAFGWLAMLGPGYGVGIVITEDSGLFCVDLDGCIVDGIIGPEAAAVLEQFPGAYIERSVSGTGLHVIGSYTGPAPLHGTKNKELHAELYTKKRFIALTEGEGDPTKDFTNQLWALAFARFPLPVGSVDSGAQWTTEDDPACTIAGSDDERIATLRATKSWAAKLSPKKVTFDDLWTANADKLEAAWPSAPGSKSGLPYDASSADQAIANHFAWGFANNCDAVQRVMLRDDCRLHRQKWDDRPDYLRATILKACALPKKWTTRRASSSRETIPYPGASVVSVQAPQQVAAPVGELVPPPPATMPVPALPAVTTNSKNKYEPSLDSVRRALDEDKLLAFDDFRDKVTMLRGVQRVPMTDENYIDLRTVFEREKNFAAIGKELMRDACFAEAKRLHYDSAIVWVDSIVWDGVPRVERFMHTHFGAVDDEYTRAVSRYMWSGIANRILDPGCQLDMVIVLQSQQGTKKSTGLELLAPEKYMFTDGLSLHIDDDNFKRQIKGKVVVEIAEGAGLSKADIGVIKRNITRKIDKYIEKYQTEETGYPRRCMFFMSVNDLEFLPPDDEHRRWLPIQVAELNRALIERDRAQLYAEGAAIYREHGQQYADAERLAKGRHKAHEQTDVWEIRIAEWLTTPPAAVDVPMPSARLFSTSEVLEGALKMRPDAMAAGHAKRVATVLRMLGYSTKQHKISGRVVRRWSLDVPPPPA